MIEVKNSVMICMFRKYNERFTAAYDELLNDKDFMSSLGSAKNEDAIKNAVYNSVQDWYETPIFEENPELTSYSFINSLTMLHEAVDLAIHAALLCDDDIPDLVKIKLSTFGPKLISELLKVVLNCNFSSSDDSNNRDMVVCAEFFKLFSEWQAKEILDEVVQKFSDTDKPNEIIAEAVRGYLVAIGDYAIPKLILQINNDLVKYTDLNVADEYLLIALTDIGKEHRSDSIFATLRDAFRKMSNKAIGAICLGDYGDGRGATVLKSWLDSHQEVTDRQIISESLSSIKRLGGDISDIQNRKAY